MKNTMIIIALLLCSIASKAQTDSTQIKMRQELSDNVRAVDIVYPKVPGTWGPTIGAPENPEWVTDGISRFTSQKVINGKLTNVYKQLRIDKHTGFVQRLLTLEVLTGIAPPKSEIQALIDSLNNH